MRIKDIMSSPVITVRPETHLKEAAAKLLQHEIAALPVVDEDGRLVGIVTEGDLIKLEREPDPRSRMLPTAHHTEAPRTVGEIMTKDVLALDEQADSSEAARLMLGKHIKHVPVMANDQLVGIVSRRDLLKILARSDVDIREELTDLLDDEIIQLGRYDVDVADGIVTLSGPADRASRRLAELLAGSVPGVVAVRFAENATTTARA